MIGSVRRAIFGLCLVLAAAFIAPAAAWSQSGAWDPIAAPPPTNPQGAPAEIEADHLLAFSLDEAALKDRLDSAPAAGLRSRTLARGSAVVLTLPAPDGTLQRFEVQESPVMQPELAARHPEIKTYAGRGLDDPAATVRADTTPLGFHASVRAPNGAWYIDPYYHLDDSVYVSYYGRDLVADPDGAFVERGPEGETDPLDVGALAAPAGPEIKLRTYRLALLTDPTYATYFGGPQNVTAAKVTLMNRVDQVYENETAIRMILIGDNDKLNLNTPADMTGPNGPCGAAACFTAAQASTCGTATLTRNHVVIGQLIGAANYDIGHIAMGNNGGGVAQLGVVGGNNKGRGCTGLTTPVGDFFAVDYVAHEMGHQFAGNHTFNGTQLNCSGTNRSAGASVEPGSGSSIMAYAGICQQDNLQPHSDPYWSQRSYDEITAYTSSDAGPINEIQTVSLREFDGTDSFTITWGGKTSGTITRGTNYTLADIQREIHGASEVQTVTLAANDTGDSHRLTYNGSESDPIVTGQNNTSAGIANAIAGGNEQQQVSLTGFNANTQSFQVQIGGNTSVVIGQGGVALNNGNLAAAINAIPGFAGTVQSQGAGSTGFTLTFTGASQNTDVPPIAIVNCTGACVATVRESAKGGTGLPSWPAGGTVAVSQPTATGYTLTLSGTLQGTDVDPFEVTSPVGLTGAVTETTKGAPGILPPHATGVVNAWGGGTTLDDTGFQVTFGAGIGGADQPPVTLDVTGATYFVGETAQGGPIENKGFIVTDTGNHAPVVETAPAFTIPLRTPFALTSSASDADGDVVTYMWEQNDRGGTTGTALVNNVKVNGPLFRQFGTAANVSATDTLLTPSPGLNAVTTDPTRVFPDMGQILANNTNAVTGTCPAAPAAPTVVPPEIRDCFSEFLPTADWVGLNPNDRSLNFRLTARDAHPGGGGIGSAQAKLTLAPDAGPFLVTSQGAAATLRGGSQQTVTWDVAGTDAAPISAAEVKISLTTGQVLAAATPNDGSATVTVPNVVASNARIKVEAVGNVFFDVSDADLAIQAAPDVVVTDPTVQYSDAVTGTVVKASDADTAGSALTATATGLPAGLSLAVGDTTEHSRTWTLAGNVTAAPGTYAGAVSVTDGDGEAITAPLTVTVKPEDADVAYIGETLTSGSTVLRATVADRADGAPGDLAHSTVTFKEGATTLCGPLSGARGVVSCRVTLAPGSHAISVVAGDYYTGSAAKTVRVNKPDNTQVIAVSDLKVAASAGTYKADVGTPLAFALDVAFKKGVPKGLTEVAYLSGGKVFRISADTFESLASDGTRAELRATADLWDHSRLLRPVKVADDATLHVTVTKGKTIAMSLWDGDTLLFSLPEQRIGGVVLIR